MISVVTVAGFAGSGKTHFSHALQRETGGTLIGFGDSLRQLAGEAGYPADRNSMIEFGRKLVAQRGMRWLIGRFTPPPGNPKPWIFEGVRNLQAAVEIGRLAPTSFAIVFLDAPNDVRLERLRERGRAGDITKDNELGFEEEGSTELSKLRDIATLVLDSRQPLDDLVRFTLRALK